MVNYKVFIEQPTLDFYRQGYCPREDYTRAGLWICVLVTGASGKRYTGERGFGELAQGMAQTYKFVKLNKRKLDDFSPELYPELPFQQMEPYDCSESADAVHFVGENVQLDAGIGGYDWHDAKGRWDIHVELIGQACTFWVPEQESIPVPHQHRSQMGKATGKINGDPVEGWGYIDASYSHPGVLYFNLPVIRKLEKQWSMWLVEYTDGEINAGFAWKGRGDIGFSAGHLIRNGVSTAVPNARTFTTYSKRGTVWKSRIELGGEVVELEQDTCAIWPVHTYGRVVSTSRGKKIAKSWNYTEWMPDNEEEIIDRGLAGEIQVHHFRKARIENERLVFPKSILKSG